MTNQKCSYPCRWYITEEFNSWIERSEAFLIAEPGTELELSLTRHFRFSLGVTHRFTSPFESHNQNHTISSNSIERFSYMTTFKFRKF